MFLELRVSQTNAPQMQQHAVTFLSLLHGQFMYLPRFFYAEDGDFAVSFGSTLNDSIALTIDGF
jgi:hypothetical protein